MRIGEAMNSDGACSEPAAEHVRALIVNFRLGPVTRLFDLPAREQSLTVQEGGRHCGDEII